MALGEHISLLNSNTRRVEKKMPRWKTIGLKAVLPHNAKILNWDKEMLKRGKYRGTNPDARIAHLYPEDDRKTPWVRSNIRCEKTLILTGSVSWKLTMFFKRATIPQHILHSYRIYHEFNITRNTVSTREPFITSDASCSDKRL